MRKLLFLFVFIPLISTISSAQLASSTYVVSSTGSISIPNDTVTGTVQNLLVVENGSLNAVTAGVNATNVIGIATSNAGTSGSVTVQVQGSAYCQFDNNTNNNDYVIPSSTSPGECHDVVHVITGQPVARVFSNTSQPSIVLVSLIPSQNPILNPTANGLLPNQGGTGITSYLAGDMLYATGPNQLARLGIGAPGTCISSNGVIPSWKTCGAGGGGGVSSVSSGGLTPLFSTTVSNQFTTPSITFTLSNAPSHSYFGNNTGSTAAPSYFQPSFNDLTGTLAAGQLGTFTGDVSNSGYAITVVNLNGTTVPTNNSADQVLLTTASSVGSWASIPSCTGSSSALQYSTVSHSLSCATVTSGSGGGSITSFSSGNLSPIFTTSVSNATTTPTLSFTLSTAGAHTYLGNNTGAIAAPTYVQPSFSDLLGNLAGTQLPTFTGDVTNSSSALTVVKINGTSIPLNSAADQVLGTTASATASWMTLPSCGDSTHALSYNTTTHTFGCQVLSGGGGSGANAALSNLASVAINTALLPGSAGTLAIGNVSLPWTGLYVGNAANNTAYITGNFSGNRTFTIPDVANSVAVALPANGGTNQYVTSIGSNGVVNFGTVNFTNLQGSLALSQTPLTTLGDLLYVNGTPTLTRLAGNITTTKMYLSQTGTSVISAAPVWSQIAAADLSNGTVGSGNIVLATSPTLSGVTLTGTTTAAALTLSGQLTSTVNGSAPFVVASNIVVTNLNANYLNGLSWSNPGAIGSTTASSGVFTDLAFSTDLRSAISGCSAASTGSIRLCASDIVQAKNQAGTGNVNIWQKLSTDVQQFGDTQGVYFPGPVKMQQQVTSKTTNYTVVTSDSNTLFTNTAATGEVDFTLPACSAGLTYSFYIDNAQIEKIIATNSAVIRYGSSLGVANGNLNAAITGNLVQLSCIGTSGADSAPEWIITKTVGNWNLN